MISVIVCSKDANLYKKICTEIDTKIGTEYEIIRINNASGIYSISEAYNIGFEKAVHDVVVFVHEDVAFITNGWGAIILNLFATNQDLGCIGVAGALYKSKAPSGWWNVEVERKVANLVQHEDGTKRLVSNGWQPGEKIKEVAVIDGVFLATKKSLGVRFDTSIPGFHCYDLGFSLEIKSKGLKAYVTKEILIEHFSLGSISKSWVETSFLFHKKKSDFLPISVLPGFTTDNHTEFVNLCTFVRVAITHKLDWIAFKYWLQIIKTRPFAFGTHYLILKTVSSRM
jgi:hypothetical protein